MSLKKPLLACNACCRMDYAKLYAAFRKILKGFALGKKGRQAFGDIKRQKQRNSCILFHRTLLFGPINSVCNFKTTRVSKGFLILAVFFYFPLFLLAF